MRKVINLILILIFFSFNLKSENELKIKTSNSNKTELKVNNKSISGFNLTSSISELSLIPVNSQKGNFVEIRIDGYVKSYNIGNPDLPVLSKMIEIPVCSGYDIKIISFEEEIIDLNQYNVNKLLPAQPSISKAVDDMSKVEFYYNESSYKKNEFSKQTIANIEVLGTMRGAKIGRLTVNPFQYNPVENKLKIINNLSIEIVFNNTNEALTTQQKQKYYSPYFENTFKKFVNHSNSFAKDTITKYPIKYLIISDPMFQAQLQPFIQWKTKKGFHVVEAYTNDPSVGTTTASIKNYIQNQYFSATPQDPAPTFVLFVGDIQQIPAFTGTTGSHVSDLYYCTFDGANDYFPEIYYGRFSAQTTAQLQPQIDKTLQYEKYLMPNPSYLDEVLLVAGVDASFAPTHGNGQINYGTTNYFNSAHGLNMYTYLYPASGSSSSQIISNVSGGVGFANYTAHCSENGWADPSFVVSDVNGLQNMDQYPLMIGNCCLSNKFDVNVCFGEALLRADKKGAIGYIGGSNNTLWDEDFYWGVGVGTITANPTYAGTTLGAYDRMMHENGEAETDWYFTNGQIIFGGNIAVTEGATSNVKYYWEIYHLMGDPSVMTYIGVPAQLNISYQSSIPIGTPLLEVNTEPNTYVAISYNNVLYDAKISDSNGNLFLDVSQFNFPCNADIVATKQNRQPFMSTVMVVPNTTAYVVYNANSINDATSNNNSLADYNETFKLNVALKNVGSILASGVSATLSTTNSNVTIIDNEDVWGNIDTNQIVTVNDAYEISVANNVVDQTNVQFSIAAKDINDSIWNSSFNIKLNAPAINIAYDGISDLTGNSNNRLDPGETVDFKVISSNNGHSNTISALATISTISQYITMNTDTVSVGILTYPSNVNSAFNFTVDPATPIGTAINFNIKLQAGAYVSQKTVTLKVGLILEDFESNDFNSYAWVNGGDLPWVITSGSPYEGAFSAKSGAITDDQVSELILDLYVLNNDSISFMKKVSSEESYDFLKFYIDDVEKGAWSGNINWSREAYPVTAGLHNFKWIYSKDGSVSSGDDNALIDYIIMPVIDNTGNLLPFFTSSPITVNDVNVIYNYNITVDDANTSDILVVACPTKPNWLSFTDNGNRTAILTGTPSSTDIGIHQVVLSVFDGIATINQSFSIAVGVPIEDWETNTFTYYPWTNTSTIPWVIVNTGQYEGNSCAKSGVISHSQSTELKINLNVTVDDNISFYKKVSSEANYDYLEFYIDGVKKDEWSGNVAWSNQQYPVLAGNHEFKWVYMKDNIVSSGSDCAWVDFIILPQNDFITRLNKEILSENYLNVYPNPANEELNITIYNTVNSETTVILTNILGETVKNINNNNKLGLGIFEYSVDISDLKSGIYFCNFYSNNNLISKKIVISK